MRPIERRRDPFRVSAGPQLGRRLIRAVVISVSTALLVSGLIFDVFAYVSLRSALVDDLTTQARIAAENSSAALLFGDVAAATQTLAGLQAAEAIERADLQDLRGRIVASYVAPTAEADHVETIVVPVAVDVHAFTDGHLHVSAAVREGERTVGYVHLRASLAPLNRRIAAYVAITVGASLLAFALAFVLVIGIRRELDMTEQRLDELAYFDPVTGLRNRHAANEQIRRLIDTVGQSSDGFALLLLDLDDFKVVNDTLGHSIGDELLRAVASRLTQFMRPCDEAFRFGGDEFVILAPRVSDRAQLQLLGQAAMMAFAEPLTVGVQELRVRGSVGVAQYPNDSHSAAALIRAADAAMYEAKGMGKNTYALFHSDMHRDVVKRMRLESDLREAVARNELRLLYQPIIDLRTQRVIGVEALLRWVHPELGVVSPVEFIPLAEYSGLIVDIGRWVLHTACRQIKAWDAVGESDFYVAVNVSARQIRRGLKAQIDDALAASGVDPHRLEIEITEHSMVEDIDSNVEQLAALRALGIQVAVDDFGTGLSSLAYLKRLPIGKLKIDRAFVKDLPDSADDAAIVSAVISMARSLSLTVVAEGVETQAQRDFLMAQGCDCAQGYFYSRPLAAESVVDLLLCRARPHADAEATDAA
jgi:diguanylate cyclase (GGDEF)-like protein